MPIIQNPSIARKLMRALRLTGLPDSILAPETVPVIVVEDLSAPLTDIVRGCQGSQNAQAIVAENPIVTLVRVGNPSSYDVVVTEIHFSSDTSQRIHITKPTVAVLGLTVSEETTFTDFTIPGRPTSQLGSDSTAAIPAGINLYEVEVLADTLYRIPTNIRLGVVNPISNAIMVAGISTNTILRAGFSWTEGPLEG